MLKTFNENMKKFIFCNFHHRLLCQSVTLTISQDERVKKI